MTLPSFEKNDNPLEVYINEHNLKKEKKKKKKILEYPVKEFIVWKGMNLSSRGRVSFCPYFVRQSIGETLREDGIN